MGIQLGLRNWIRGNMLMGGGFNPKSIVGLAMWYDALDLSSITKDGANLVSLLNDKSGNGIHLLQNTGANKPTWTIGSNGKGLLQIRSNKELHYGVINLPQPWTIFLVGKLNTFYNRNIILGGNTAGGVGIDTYYSGATNNFNCLCFVGGVAWTPTTSPIYLPLNANSINQFTIKTDGHSDIRINSSPHYRTYITTDEVMGGGTAAMSYLRLGSLQAINYAINSSADYDFHECIVYNRALTIDEQLLINNYLHNKYSIIKDDYLLFCGNSITYGAIADNYQTHGFAALTGIELNKKYVNLGKSSSALTGANSLYSYRSQILDTTHGWLISSYGTNESVINDAWRDAYIEILNDLINAGQDRQKILLLTEPYHSTQNAKYLSVKNYLDQITSQLSLHAPVDTVAYFQANGGDANMSDLQHPNTQGHRNIADYLKTFIT